MQHISRTLKRTLNVHRPTRTQLSLAPRPCASNDDPLLMETIYNVHNIRGDAQRLAKLDCSRLIIPFSYRPSCTMKSFTALLGIVSATLAQSLYPLTYNIIYDEGWRSMSIVECADLESQGIIARCTPSAERGADAPLFECVKRLQELQRPPR